MGMLLISTLVQPALRYWPRLPTSIENWQGIVLQARVAPSAIVTTRGLPVLRFLTARPERAWPLDLRRSNRKVSLLRCSQEKSQKENLNVLLSETNVWETAFGFGFWLSETFFGVPSRSILVPLKGVTVAP